jgi:2-(1,2-epoxy-1,2-dihydrophenyl)acetyl-CoA isomerase
MYQQIDYEVSEGIATIFLNRPEKKNAYTPAMGMEIVAAMEAAVGDRAVRVIILTGRGAAFCAGVDLDFLRAHMAGEDTGPGPALGEEHLVNGWPLEMVAYPKPVIAALNGTAYGVGVTMTLGCDVRYAEAGATLGLNFTTLGVLPGLGSTHHLPQLVGVGKALELILSGAKLSAEDACTIGLVQRVCPAGEVYTEARELAQAMARVKPEVLAAAKKALRQGVTSSLEQAIATEKSLSRELGNLRPAKP